MSYQVLARKWRPQIFDQLVGQDHIAQTLLNALKSDRMPHALLFTGARGVGKTSAARILAKSLRCPNVKDFVPCGQCDDCQDIAQGRSVNVIEIDGASNNSVDNVRELRESVGYMPSTGKYKVYIIDEVHMLTTSAFNALLKTLEEPPPHVIFIFATTEIQKIPVTILSRCQRFDFRRIPVKKVAERLQSIVDAEKFSIEPKALWLIARESDGSMRDGQSLLDQVISFCGSKITYAQVVEILGLTDRTLLADTLKALITRNTAGALESVSKIYSLGYDVRQFAQDLLEHIRNLMVVKLTVENPQAVTSAGGGNFDFLDLPQEEIEDLKSICSEVSAEDIHMLFDMTFKGVSEVLRAQDSRVVLEMLLMRISQAPTIDSIEKYIHGDSDGSPAPRKEIKITEPPKVQVVEKKLTGWEGFLESVKKERPMLAAKLEYAALDVSESGHATMYFAKEHEFVFGQINQKETVTNLHKLLVTAYNNVKSLEVKLGRKEELPSLSPVLERANAAKEAERSLKEKIEAHPLVKSAKENLNGQITRVKELT